MLRNKLIASPSQLETLNEGMAMLKAKNNLFTDLKTGIQFLRELLAAETTLDGRLGRLAEIPELEGLGPQAQGRLKGVYNCVKSLSPNKLEAICDSLAGHFKALGFSVLTKTQLDTINARINKGIRSPEGNLLSPNDIDRQMYNADSQTISEWTPLASTAQLEAMVRAANEYKLGDIMRACQDEQIPIIFKSVTPFDFLHIWRSANHKQRMEIVRVAPKERHPQLKVVIEVSHYVKDDEKIQLNKLLRSLMSS